MISDPTEAAVEILVGISPGAEKNLATMTKWQLLRRRRRGEAIRASCGMFLTPKQLKKIMRIIFDARPANTLLERKGNCLALFGLTDLFTTWRLFGGTVSVTDLRHQFYQLPIKDDLASYFGLFGKGGSLARCPWGITTRRSQDRGFTILVTVERHDDEDPLGVDEEELSGPQTPQ